MIWFESDMQGLRLIIAAVLLVASLLLGWKSIARVARSYRSSRALPDRPTVYQMEEPADA